MENAWISNPLDLIRQVFSSSEGGDWETLIREEFAAKCSEQKADIPYLGADSPSGSLVRCQCMIQDMLDQEFYMKRYLARDRNGNEHIATGKYSDIPNLPKDYDIDFESREMRQDGRLVYYCVPVPGRSSWTSNLSTQPDNLPDQPDNLSSAKVHTININKTGLKRPLEGIEEEMDTSSDEAKKQKEEKDEDKKKEEDDKSTFSGLNMVLPTDVGACCVSLVYDKSEEVSPFKINDMIEIIGIVERLEQPSEVNMELEEVVRFPPSSIVPRVHCISVTKLPHINPLVPSPDCLNVSEFNDIRSELLSLLKECVCGDPVAAEYLLLHLISTVYARCDDVMALGKFAVNISKCPSSKQFVTCLSSLLSQITEKCFLLPMTITNLNNLTTIPKKDYNANRLKSGMLQLADSTQVIIDETVLQPGQLLPNGVENVKSLGNLISWQKLQYDFGFNYNIEFECNTRVLILSEGKSLLPSDVHIPLKAMVDMPDYDSILDRALSSKYLDKIRAYLTVCKVMEYKEVGTEVRGVIEKDFVSERKSNPKKVTGDTLHTSLVTARLVAMSRGHTTLTLEDWGAAKSLEKDRLSRFS